MQGTTSGDIGVSLRERRWVRRGSFRKVFKRGQNLMVKKIGVEGLTSLALTPHAVFTSSKGWGGGGGGVGGGGW